MDILNFTFRYFRKRPCDSSLDPTCGLVSQIAFTFYVIEDKTYTHVMQAGFR